MSRERADVRRRVRLLIGWLLTGAVVLIYFVLPDGDGTPPMVPPTREGAAEIEVRKLEVIDVSPSDANPGSAVTVTYQGAEDEPNLQVFVGKEPLHVLARRAGSIVAQLPPDLPVGHAKVRVSSAGQRSKPYDIRLKATNWRKPFRSLVGGLALLLFGIGILARGARAAAGRESARVLARLAARRPAALGLGTLVGALAQSTTAAAGLLAGLVASSLLAIGPAASAFLGAQLGAAAAPLVTGIIDSREGLLIIAIGVLWSAFASDRRAKAVSRLVLGAGLISFGLQTLRPGFEPFVHDPNLLSVIAGLRATAVSDIAVCALLGVGLVALLQGPAPVVVLVIVLAQTTAQWDLRTALAVLSGAGLGSAVGALLTTPPGRRGRRLAQLYLVLGVLGTVFTASTVDVWSALADKVVPGVPHEMNWGKRVLMPNLALHLGVAFAFSQLASALLLLPCVPRVAALLERLLPDAPLPELAKIGDVKGVVQSGLAQIVAIERDGIRRLSELVMDGNRDAGRYAEHRLADAHARSEELLSGAVLALPDDTEGAVLSRASFAGLGVLRSLEGLHRQAERLTDSRLALAGGESEILPMPSDDAEVLLEMHSVLEAGLSAVADSLRSKSPVDLESALEREIRLNGLEARVRAALQRSAREPVAVQRRLAVLELADAYETAGNQLYRLTETLAEWSEPANSMLRSSAGTA